MRILVIGGTGQVGRPLVHHLRDAGATVTIMARRPGSGGIALDLAETEKLSTAARSFDAVYFSTPIGPDETRLGLGVVKALRKAGVGKIVYLAAHHLDAMSAIPHFAAKIPIRNAVLDGRSGVVLAPNFFFQNDVLVLDAIRNLGVYPLPVGSVGVASIDVSDIALAAARALVRQDWNGQIVPLCGPDMLTGAALAANWADALDRPVIYGGDAIAPFLAGMKMQMPGFDDWFADDFEHMMRVTHDLGCPASDADHAATRDILGCDPRTHASFVRALQNDAPLSLQETEL